MVQPVPTSGLAAPVRPEWLARRSEPPLLPDLPIVDAHHHLWDRPGDLYLIDDLAGDVKGGHRIAATIYVQCRSMYRSTGPEHLRSVGEVEFAAGIAAGGAYGETRFCAGIVGATDLRRHEAVDAVLAAMERAGGGHFRGIRQVASWDADERVSRKMDDRPPGLLLDPDFRRGFARLAAAGLRFDAFVFHPQLGEVASLARAFPDASIILDHCGGPVALGAYARRRAKSRRDWLAGLREVADCPNVTVKISGLGMRMAGFDFHERPEPPTSAELADAWRPYAEPCIEIFGPERCMFASNFSPDKGSCSYVALWNAFKRICEGASDAERKAMFHDTAARVYDLEPAGMER